MKHQENTHDFDSLQTTLLEPYPERCKRYGACATFSLRVSNAATSILLGETTLDKEIAVATQHAGEVDSNCRDGLSLQEGDPPYPVCQIGRLCNSPA